MTQSTGDRDISGTTKRPMLPYGIGARTKYLFYALLGFTSGPPFRTPSAVISFSDGISIIDVLEPPTMEETKLMIRYVAATGIYPRRLWDFSKIQWPFSNDEIIEFAQYGASVMDTEGRLAVLVNDDLGAGTSEVFARHRATGQLTFASVFRSEDDALAWLRSDSAPS